MSNSCLRCLFSRYTKYFIPKPVRNFWNIIVVWTGTIRNSIKATGKVYEAKESNLAFTKQWKITYLWKKVGDTVKVGDLIAEVDSKTAKLDVESASVNLANAQNNLNKLLIWSTDVEKIRASNNVFLLLTQKQNSQNFRKIMITSSEKENTLKTAQNNIISTQFPSSYFILALTPFSILLSQSFQNRKEKWNIFTFFFLMISVLSMQWVFLK